MSPASDQTWSIRVATQQDFDAIVAVWQSSGSNAKLLGRESREAFSQQLKAFPNSYLVAVDADKVVGVVLGSHDHRKGWINRLAVSPNHRRKGIATQLVESCEAALAQSGMDLIVAHVESHNASSAAFFKKLGYADELPVRYFRKLARPEA